MCVCVGVGVFFLCVCVCARAFVCVCVCVFCLQNNSSSVVPTRFCHLTSLPHETQKAKTNKRAHTHIYLHLHLHPGCISEMFVYPVSQMSPFSV